MLRKTLAIVLLSYFLPSCQTKQQQEEDDLFNLDSSDEIPPSDLEPDHDDNKEYSAKQRLKLKKSSARRFAALHHYEENEMVQRWMSHFTTSYRETFEGYMRRGSKYRRTIETILRQHDIPEFLYYLAMMESGFTVTARSSASAVGIWQFIEPTAKRYNLAVNSYVDERRDPIRATIAAAKYLKDLHNVFQSWFLAMAAYNSGESRVMNAIMKFNTRDFWKLTELKAFPPETREYVPKIIAAAIIDKNAATYGFSSYEPRGSLHLKLAKVPAPTSIKAIAEAVDLPDDKLRYYNPQLLGKYTPPGNEHYRIWLPANLTIPEGSLSTLPRLTAVDHDNPLDSSPNTYRVRKGDSLQDIANKFSTSVASLKAGNHIVGQRIYPNQALKVGKQDKNRKFSVQTYRVRRGDTLSSLAKRFGITIERLKQANGLTSGTLRAGQELKIVI